MIIFDSQTIRCGNVHSGLHLKGGDVQLVHSYFWGLRGVSEIVGSPAAWTIESLCWLNDAQYTTLKPLTDYLKTLRDWRGKHGRLRETHTDVTEAASWRHATFLGFEPVTFQGHDTASPLQDHARGLHTSAVTWFIQGKLRWILVNDE